MPSPKQILALILTSWALSPEVAAVPQYPGISAGSSGQSSTAALKSSSAVPLPSEGTPNSSRLIPTSDIGVHPFPPAISSPAAAASQDVPQGVAPAEGVAHLPPPVSPSVPSASPAGSSMPHGRIPSSEPLVHPPHSLTSSSAASSSHVPEPPKSAPPDIESSKPVPEPTEKPVGTSPACPPVECPPCPSAHMVTVTVTPSSTSTSTSISALHQFSFKKAVIDHSSGVLPASVTASAKSSTNDTEPDRGKDKDKDIDEEEDEEEDVVICILPLPPSSPTQPLPSKTSSIGGEISILTGGGGGPIPTGDTGGIRLTRTKTRTRSRSRTRTSTTLTPLVPPIHPTIQEGAHPTTQPVHIPPPPVEGISSSSSMIPPIHTFPPPMPSLPRPSLSLPSPSLSLPTPEPEPEPEPSSSSSSSFGPMAEHPHPPPPHATSASHMSVSFTSVFSPTFLTQSSSSTSTTPSTPSQSAHLAPRKNNMKFPHIVRHHLQD
ncbi:uncharacterized protein BO97DRAFT_454155 [Aspergillus homomorphus CBS 101889]|uniref:Uncharacterized protein n=1 Tax=Aspergillus homomorphus (strain CBS 101889) TaxID=1450537 RepID=A0A395HTZ5_ASPHC|nr:hypothetical protein BO97DRAFT_454155 [Aspergillus homomorphus CBS 101889]RAL11277.1 hypothetical protein BO97DRAFT_454155 [Aspergillus homomorphus CBS 101889]